MDDQLAQAATTPLPAHAAPVDPMLATAVMASHGPMVVCDPHLPDCPIVLANQAFCRMTGYEPGELLGRNPRMMQGPRTDPDAVRLMRGAIKAGRETAVGLLNYRRNGTTFWSEVFLSPVFAADGTLRYFIAAQQDSTERRGDVIARDPRLAAPASTRVTSWEWEPRTGEMGWGEATSALFGVQLPPRFDFDLWTGLIHPDDRAAAVDAARAIVAVGQMTFEFRIDRRGETRWIEAAGSVALRDERGSARTVSGVMTDITRRRGAERALQAREARTRLALDAARAGAFEFDPLTGRAVTSPRYDEIMGHSQLRGPWSLERLREALLPADRDAALAGLTQTMQARAPLHTVHRIRAPAGSVPRWVETWARPASSESSSYYGIVVDVTERKLAEEALANAKAGFQLALESAGLGRWDYDLRNGVSYWDDRLRRIWGSVDGAPLDGGRDAFIARIHPQDRDAVIAASQHAQTPGDGVFDAEFRLCPIADEAPRWVHMVGQAFFEHGQCTRFLGVCGDITEAKRTALALQDINRTLEAEVAARTRDRDRTWRFSQELLAVSVAGQGMVSTNPSWQRVLGWTREQLAGRSLLEFVHPDDARATSAELQRASGGVVSPQFRNRCLTAAGEVRHISWTMVAEADAFYFSGRDVTGLVESAGALEQAQAQMRQMQKMEAVGQLTGGIAHDFNNMLSVVIGGLTLLERRLARGETDVQRFIDSALDGARRAGALTQRLLAFSRQQPLQPQPIGVGQLVRGMIELLHRTLGEMVQLDTTIAPDLWLVNVDPSQMENVVLNLAVNARDAMNGGGRLGIVLDNTLLSEADAQPQQLAAGDYVRLVVRDTGAGMSGDVLARAFEPFFTTKAVGAGTGLGLSQAYGFARQSGGTARIASKLDHGTTVTILLPRHVGPGAAMIAPARHAPRDQPTGETILLVEDEDRVRQLSADALRELGYAVIETDGASAALRALEAHPEVVLLFTDVVMPDVNGRALADEALRRRPGLHVLFTTGYARDAMVHDGVVEPGTHLLTKPFTVDHLAVKLREILDD